MRASNPKVFIVLLNWNSFADSRECLLSLREITYPNYDIILVDNASIDGSAQRLADEFPEVMLIVNEENLGFAAGCNVGIKRAIQRNADYILLLNNDTLVKPDFLEPAVAFTEENVDVGLVGGKIYKYGEGKRLWDAGGEINWLRGFGKRMGWGQLDVGQFDTPRLTTFVTGCLMLIKKEVVLNVGLLPEEYFFGVEAWDYSVRVARAGYKLAYVPQFVIWHKVGGAHNDHVPKWVYCYLRSRLLFMQRNASKAWYPIWFGLMRAYAEYKKYVQFPRIVPDNADRLRQAIDQAFVDHQQKSRITRQDLEMFG